VAANVDVVFLVAGLDGDLNLRRLERYLTLGWESGAEPVVVLTKADLCDDPEGAVLEVETVAIGVGVHPISNVTGAGVEALARYFAGDRTVAALGSSGVGKSSLVNRLAGEELMAIGDLRADGRGRHTTTNRQLILLPQGGLFLDTPGMRELRLWESEDGLAAAFDDVAAAAAGCRFADCAHETEPGCGVRQAIADGTLDAERFASWRKLQSELRHLALKQDARLRADARRERRRFERSMRKVSW
jgi:ribosome biogenesis GTPase / thiamine phosphate phosphatase